MLEHTEGHHSYYVYIITNAHKTVLYIGVSNNLRRRLAEHQLNASTGAQTFAAKFKCFHLIYYERFGWIQLAIAREKQLKGWTRQKKLELISSFNPDLEFLESKYTERAS